MAPLCACPPEELWKSVVVKNTFLDVNAEPMYDRRLRASSTPPALRSLGRCPRKASDGAAEPDDAASTDGGDAASTAGDASSAAGDLDLGTDAP
mmetsp:Transcript_85576/g.231920  ORF Transcript_85576/g.231920 Transcript_85576/m.231920 type:complete len:94 (+) Transcript_85576:89-370(+)